MSSLVAILVAAELMARMMLPLLPEDVNTWPRAEIGQKLDQISDLEETGEKVDVVFAGSSLAAAAINPQLFTERTGLSSYNAAFAGPSMKTVARWVLDVIEPKLSPDIVVIGVASRDVNDNSAKNNSMHEVFVRSPGYKQETSSLASRIEGRLEELSVFMKYRRLFREPATLFTESNKKKKEQRIRKTIGPRGLRVEKPKDYRFYPDFAERVNKGTLADFSTGGGELDALFEMNRTLEERGVELIILNMPVTSHYIQAHENPAGNMDEYHDFLEGYVAETGVTFVDGEDAFPTPSPFRDIMHLDVEGRDALTASLVTRWDAMKSGDRLTVSCTNAAEPSCSMRQVAPD